MGLGLPKSNASGDFLPVFKFNSVSGDAVISSSERNSAGDFEKTEKDVKFPAKFIFDFENILVGWMYFSTAGVSFHLVKIGEPMPPIPADHDKVKKKYGSGFQVTLYNKEHGVSVFSQSSKTVSESMDELYDSYVAGSKANPGKVAVVEIKGTEKITIKTREGNKNYKKPLWSIIQWVPRPEALDAKPVEAPVAEALADDEAF